MAVFCEYRGLTCKRRGDSAFAVAGPKLWNSLPLSVKTSSTLAEFKSRLKTHIFSCAFNYFYFVFVYLLLFLYFILLCTALWPTKVEFKRAFEIK